MNIDGTLVLDRQNLTASKVNVTIPIAPMDTGVPKMDEHLKSKDFFDAATYPTATFISNTVDVTSKDTVIVHGTLTLHGYLRRSIWRSGSTSSARITTRCRLRASVLPQPSSVRISASPFSCRYCPTKSGSRLKPKPTTQAHQPERSAAAGAGSSALVRLSSLNRCPWLQGVRKTVRHGPALPDMKSLRKRRLPRFPSSA